MRIVCANDIKSAIKRPGVLLPRRVFKPRVEVQPGRPRGERLRKILRVNAAGKQGFSGKLGGDGLPIKAGAATTIAGVKNKLVDAVSYRSGPLLAGLRLAGWPGLVGFARLVSGPGGARGAGHGDGPPDFRPVAGGLPDGVDERVFGIDTALVGAVDLQRGDSGDCRQLRPFFRVGASGHRHEFQAGLRGDNGAGGSRGDGAW